MGETARPILGLKRAKSRASRNKTSRSYGAAEAGVFPVPGGEAPAVLALPAELNGRPGPAHLLELSEELELSASQVEAISAIHEQMRTAAVAAGGRFITAEAALSDAFVGPELSKENLRQLLAEAAEARAELRFIHLSQHLSTPELLSDAQIQRYNVLRGYANDPCENVPDGHDPEMWHRHNGCE